MSPHRSSGATLTELPNRSVVVLAPGWAQLTALPRWPQQCGCNYAGQLYPSSGGLKVPRRHGCDHQGCVLSSTCHGCHGSRLPRPHLRLLPSLLLCAGVRRGAKSKSTPSPVLLLPSLGRCRDHESALAAKPAASLLTSAN